MARPTKEFQAFDSTMRQLLTVPKAAVVERVAAHRERAAQNPRKRGPKPKPAQKSAAHDPGNPGGDNPRNRGLQPRGNFHPTVKPVELMRWLVRLVTPVRGTVLDPFTGSGTTGMAARYEQRPFIGIEREADYVAIAERRIGAVTPLFAEGSENPSVLDAVDPVGGIVADGSTRDAKSLNLNAFLPPEGR